MKFFVVTIDYQLKFFQAFLETFLLIIFTGKEKATTDKKKYLEGEQYDIGRSVIAGLRDSLNRYIRRRVRKI